MDGRPNGDRDGGGLSTGATLRSKLDSYKAYLRTLIAERTDISSERMHARLKDERDLSVGVGAL